MDEQQPVNPNLGRYVALFTPLIGAPVAGYVAAVVSNLAPGIDIPDKGAAGAITHAAIFIVGALIALSKSLAWQKGWRAYEQDTRLLESGVTPPAPGVVEANGGPDYGDGGGGGGYDDGGYDDGGGGGLEPWEEAEATTGAGEATSRWMVPAEPGPEEEQAPSEAEEMAPPSSPYSPGGGATPPSGAPPGMQFPSFGAQPGPA